MITSHEELLAPALELLAARGEVRIADAVQILATRFGLPRAHRHFPRPTASTADQLVVSALHSLGAAGLLKISRPHVWKITDDGRTLTQTRPIRLSFESLKQFPAYNEYWAGVTRDNLRRKYLHLRFEHYASGRLLFLQGSHAAAAVLLAYAIEYHLKAALVEVEPAWTTRERRLVEREHDLVALYRACLERDLLSNTYISFDFLEYAHDHFERRYPSREERLMAARGYWRFGGSLIKTYDDCIVQMDCGLAEAYGSQAHRLGLHAVSGLGVSSRLVDSFFHDNVFAIEDLPLYRDVLPTGRHLNLDAASLDRPDLLLARDGLPHPGFTYARAREVVSWDLAAYFRYPKRDEPDPDPARLLHLRATSAAAIFSSRWVIERIVKAFGYGAVEVKEDREADQVTVTVFDRRAKKWYRGLLLKSGFIEPLFRSTANEAFVEGWIEDTRAAFKSLRRNLRIPPKDRRII